MALPQRSERATTEFQRRLQEQGFARWYSFDFETDQTALWKAIALGILIHSENRYPGVSDYLERVWKPKVASLLRVNRQFKDNQGENRVNNLNYWKDIGQECMNIAIKFFMENSKPHHANEVRAGGCPDKVNKAAYDNLASYLSICICWYECKADGSILTHLFHCSDKSEPSLFIHVGQESGRLYFLYHREIDGPVHSGFPFFMVVKVDGEPLKIGGAVQISPSRNDPKDALIERLMALIDAESALILATNSILPPNLEPHLLSVKEKFRLVQEHVTAARLPVSISTNSLSQVMSLEVHKPVSAPIRDPHTIVTCEQYPETGEFVMFHFHQFHKSCLAEYLGTLRLEPPNLPHCPVPGCTDSLPDTALDLNPDVRQRYTLVKEQTLISAWTVPVRTDAQTVQSHPFSTIKTIRCKYCQREFDQSWFVRHGCQLCIPCAYQYYSPNCPMCRFAYGPEDQSMLQWYIQSLSSPQA